MPLTLDEAQTVIAGAHERAAQIGAQVTVAVVDEGGHLQALGRMNGAPPLSARIAETKAVGVALFRRDGAALRQMQETSPAFFAQLNQALPVPILVGAGAALLRRGDTVLGALAVSGGTAPGQDDDIAEAALAVTSGTTPAQRDDIAEAALAVTSGTTPARHDDMAEAPANGETAL